MSVPLSSAIETLFGVDRRDRAGVSVGDRECTVVVVAAQHDSFTWTDEQVAVGERVGVVEFAGCEQMGEGSRVELSDEFVGASEHHRLESVAAGGRPHVDRRVDEVVAGGSDRHAAVLDVGVDRRGDVAVAEFVERCVFPRLVLAAIDGEFGDAVRPCSAAWAKPPPAPISGSWWWSPASRT